MSRLITMFSILVLVIFASGCPQINRGNIEEPVTVEIIGGDSFPDFLVGTWRGNIGERTWEFVFESDGTISFAKTARGGEITPGEVSYFEKNENEDAVYIPGQWAVSYDHDTNILKVDAIMDYIKVVMSMQRYIEGSTGDFFYGPVYEEGNIWKAEHLYTTKLTAYAPKPKDLSVGLDEAEPEKFVFYKVQGDQ